MSSTCPWASSSLRGQKQSKLPWGFDCFSQKWAKHPRFSAIFFKNKRDAPGSQSFFIKTSETTLWFRLFLSKTGENTLWFHPFSVKTDEYPLWFWVFSAYTCGLPAVVSWPKRSASTHCLMLHRHEKRSIHPCGWIDLLKFYYLKFRAVGQQQRVLYQLH